MLPYPEQTALAKFVKRAVNQVRKGKGKNYSDKL